MANPKWVSLPQAAINDLMNKGVPTGLHKEIRDYFERGEEPLNDTIINALEDTLYRALNTLTQTELVDVKAIQDWLHEHCNGGLQEAWGCEGAIIGWCYRYHAWLERKKAAEDVTSDVV